MPHAKEERADVYQRVTDQIIAAIEKGAGRYEMPWHSNSGMPMNIASGKFYRGVNVPILWSTCQERGYGSPIFGTYQQWQDKKAQVRKGEKSATVVFWKFSDGKKEGEDGNEEDTDAHRRPMARAYSVFNADQVDGYTPPPPAPPLPPGERIAHADEFFDSTGAIVKHEGARAFYRPSTDEIYLPPFEVFKDAPAYYGVRAHETAHWSGAEKRLNRQLKNRFGDEHYAFEELVAELSSAYVLADLGIALAARQENAAYVESWLKVLRNDKKAIFSAASHAQRAADYLHSLQSDKHIAINDTSSFTERENARRYTNVRNILQSR